MLQGRRVPLIVTGPSHFEKNNAVMKHIAAAFAGENLLLNWVETDNYKTIAAAAMGYGHCVVAQSADRREHVQAAQYSVDQYGPCAGKDRHRSHDRRAGLWAGIHVLGDGAHSHLRIHGRQHAGHADASRRPVTRWHGTKESRAPRSDFPLWGRKKSAARCSRSPPR